MKPWELFNETSEASLTINGKLLEGMLVARTQKNRNYEKMTKMIRVLLGQREELLRNRGLW